MPARRATVSSAMMASASSFAVEILQDRLLPHADGVSHLGQDFHVADILPFLEVAAEDQFHQRVLLALRHGPPQKPV